MNYLLILIYSIITGVFFVRKKEYVLATFLVGQPVLKFMIKPFPAEINQNLFIVYYLIIGLFFFAIIKNRKNRKLSIQKSSLKIILTSIFFGIFMVFYLLVSPMKDYGSAKIIDYVTIIFLIIFLTVVFLKNTDDFMKLLVAISNLSLLIGIITIGIIYFNTGGLFARLGTTAAREIEVFGVNFVVSIWYGRRMGLGFLSALFETKLNPSRFNKIKTLLLFILTVLSVSRGPIFATFISLFIVMIMEMKKKKSYESVLKYIVLFLTISTIGILIFTFNLDQSSLNRLITLDDGNAQGRLYLYKMSANIFFNNPLGIGLGGFASYGGIHRYPHNIILEVLVELGIVGFIIFMILIVKSIFSYHKCRVRCVDINDLGLIQYSLIVLVFALINAQFSGDIGSNEYIGLGIVLLAIVKQLVVRKEIEVNKTNIT